MDEWMYELEQSANKDVAKTILDIAMICYSQGDVGTALEKLQSITINETDYPLSQKLLFLLKARQYRQSLDIITCS